MRKYIDDLGIKFKDTPQGWIGKKDKRNNKWKKERKKYGFDVRETWSLNYTIKLFLYERLCMYNDVNIVDTDYHKFDINGEQLTFQQCIDLMIEGLELDLTLDEFDEKRKDKEVENKINNYMHILAECLDCLWW